MRDEDILNSIREHLYKTRQDNGDGLRYNVYVEHYDNEGQPVVWEKWVGDAYQSDIQREVMKLKYENK